MSASSSWLGSSGAEIAGYQFRLALLAVAVGTAAVMLSGLNIYHDQYAETQVYALNMSPCPTMGMDLELGQARYDAERGFMSMTLEELDNYFAHNATRTKDVYQYQSWKLPSLFVKEGGDCEDFVLFALCVLDHERYDLKPIVGAYDGYSHVFLLVRDNEHTYLADTGGVRLLEAGAYDDLDLLPERYVAYKVLTDALRDHSLVGLIT